MFSKKKLLIGMALVALIAVILVSALPSETWDCYNVGDDCECVHTTEGGEGQCLVEDGPEDHEIYFTSEAYDIPTMDWCKAFMTCSNPPYPISCYGTSKCEAYIGSDDKGYVRCDGMWNSCN